MYLLAKKASERVAGWNKRPFNESDVARLCGEFSITVDERPLLMNGFYYRVAGGDFIVLNSRLSGLKRLEVFFHEFAHFLFHALGHPTAVGFHHVGYPTREEREADAFALCALLPRRLLASRTRDELLADGFSPEMISLRFQIYESCGI